MKNLVLLLMLLVSLIGFAQSKLSPGTASYDAHRSVKNGYTTELGWSLLKGDTIKLGIGSRDRQSFNYIYSSPESLSQFLDTNNSERIKYLSSQYNNKIAIIKKFGVTGNKKIGYHAYAVVGIGEMENYWIDIENSIEFAELIPQNEKYIPKYEPMEVKMVGSSSDKYDQLKKLKELLDDGIISKDEYEIEKKKILDKE